MSNRTNQEAELAWQQFADADNAMLIARKEFLKTDWEPAIRHALATYNPRALELLKLLRSPKHVTMFAYELLDIALSGKYTLMVRQLLATLDPLWWQANGRKFVEQTITSPDSTYWEFRRLAELLEYIDDRELLHLVVEEARKSDNPDMLDFVEDYQDPEREKNISDYELDVIELRAVKASPRPWIAHLESGGGLAGPTFIQLGRDNEQPDMYINHDDKTATDSDHLFIAHARQDIPRLINEVRRLKSKLEET